VNCDPAGSFAGRSEQIGRENGQKKARKLANRSSRFTEARRRSSLNELEQIGAFYGRFLAVFATKKGSLFSRRRRLAGGLSGSDAPAGSNRVNCDPAGFFAGRSEQIDRENCQKKARKIQNPDSISVLLQAASRGL
jgi:hypothetical protein